MSFSSCPGPQELEEWLSEAPSASTSDVGAHVASCGHCRASVEHLRASMTGLADTVVSSPDLSPDAAATGTRVFPTAPGRFSSPGGLVELGRGGLGHVLLQRDHAIGRDVAVKVLNPVPAPMRAAAEARFVREARLAGQLEHPGIVPLYDFGRDERGDLLAVMRRIGGRTLAATIAAAPTLEERLRLVPHVVALAQAVAYAHSRGVIHRDIKPQNVMVGTFGETLLLDWGLARVHGAPDDPAQGVDSSDAIHTRQGAAMGTPAYMSPEQANGQMAEVDERSDLFALGAVLFEVIAGRPPFADATVEGALTRARLAAVPTLTQLVPGVPRELAAITHRCLAAKKTARYPDVKALLADLERYLAGRRVWAYEYTQLELARRLLRRHRVTAAAVVVALVVGAVAAFANHLRVRQERNNYRGLATFVLNDTVTALKDAPGGRKIIQGLAGRVQQVLREVGTGRDAPFEDRAQLRLALSNIAETQFAQGSPNDALVSYEVASALAADLVAERPNLQTYLALANDLAEYAHAMGDTPRTDEAGRLLDDAFQALAAARRLAPAAPEVDQQESLLLSFRVSACERAARWDEGLAWAERGVALDQSMAAKLPDSARDRFNACIGQVQLANLARLGGHRDRAATALGDAFTALEALQERYPGTTDSAEAQIEVHSTAAHLAHDEGRADAESQALAKAREAIDWLLLHEPDNTEYHRNLLDNQLRRRELDGALESARAALQASDLEIIRPLLVLTFFLAEPPEQALARVGDHPQLRGDGSAVVLAMTAALAGRPRDAIDFLRGDAERALPEPRLGSGARADPAAGSGGARGSVGPRPGPGVRRHRQPGRSPATPPRHRHLQGRAHCAGRRRGPVTPRSLSAPCPSAGE